MKNSAKSPAVPPSLKLAIDMGPLLVFFLSYRIFGLFEATVALIASTALALAISYAIERKIAVMPLFSGVAVAVFGGLTLLLQDETFIKMKPTLVNLLFAAILFGGTLLGRPTLKYLMQHSMQLTTDGWRTLSLRWGFFFVFLACVNEFVWRSFSTDFWVNFKVFGMLSMTVIFTLCQVPLVKRSWVEAPAEELHKESV